jgi:tetratricopeptide (TPR) repeat protein
VKETASAPVTTDPQIRRRRLQAGAGLWLLLAGTLTAMSLFPVVLALSLLMLVAGLWVIGRDRVREIDVVSTLRAARHSTAAALGGIKARTARLVAGLWVIGRDRVREIDVEAALRATRNSAAGALGAIKARTPRLGIRALVSRITVTRDDPRRQAAALNARGRRLRRDGDPSQAAEQHRAALVIMKDLGDRQGEALTRNHLGLALARCGAGDAAVEQLQYALLILRALGDEEHEARVIANLGFVQRRRGHREAAAVLFHEALDKLPPESPAYQRVEAVLTRAG